MMSDEHMMSECQFSEKFLQVIWNERHLSGDLHVESGERLKIVSQGTWNVAGGPDFRNAALLFEDVLVTGDVELHRRSSDWLRHGHDADRAYDNVILHVVWKDDAPLRPGLRVLVLAKCLHPDWERLLWDLEDACYPYSRQVPAGDCVLRWAMTGDSRVRDLLSTAGLARFSAKGVALLRLAADRGREQAIYETLFETLGYKNNRAAFRSIAQQASLSLLRNAGDSLGREAILFGFAGMIPDPTRQPVLPEWRAHVADLWDRWWHLGIRASEPIHWSGGSTRPYNTPFRRLAVGLRLLERTACAPAQWLVDTAAAVVSPKELLKRLAALGDGDSAWRELRDFGHRIAPPADLLGRERLLDMAANVILPFLAASAPEGSHQAELARICFQKLPLSQDNRLFKEAVQRFLSPPSRLRDLVKGACHQQGLLDIYSNFCLALDNDCRHCPLARGEDNAAASPTDSGA